MARKGNKGWMSEKSVEYSRNLRGKQTATKQRGWDTERVWWAPMLVRGKLHVEYFSNTFPGVHLLRIFRCLKRSCSHIQVFEVRLQVRLLRIFRCLRRPGSHIQVFQVWPSRGLIILLKHSGPTCRVLGAPKLQNFSSAVFLVRRVQQDKWPTNRGATTCGSPVAKHTRERTKKINTNTHTKKKAKAPLAPV